MILALTALGDWWEKDEELLLLGPWCVPYGNRKKLESLRWRMLPSPWEDRQRLHAASVYADEVYRRLLPHVSARLNQALGVQEPLAYWRLLIGPWLLHFVHSLYDRHAHLSDALSFAPDLRTAVLAERCFRTPPTTRDALTWLPTDDHYNWQLLSEVLGLMGETTTHQPRGKRTVDTTFVRAPLPRRTTRIRRCIGLAQARVLRTQTGGRRAWLTGITASRPSLLGLALRSGLQLVPAPVADVLGDRPYEPVWDERRSSLSEVPASDDFEAVCARMLPRHLPTIYLEGYHDARRTTRNLYPYTPSLLVTETEWYMNETYKHLAADALGRGARLVTAQHGGYYGYASLMPFEAVEREIGHSFFAWGWADGQPQLRNVPHPIVSRHPPRRRALSTRMLFAVHVAERYLYRLAPPWPGSLWEPQRRWQELFVGALPAQLRRHLALRPPPREMGQSVRQRLCDRYPEITIDSCAEYKQSVARSRLTILERPGTCFLESLAMNGPTVLFWDPTLWNFRGEAVPYLDALRRVGILWDSPEGAAGHVEAVYADPATWWNSAPVQAARGAFAERFALARRDWPGCWIRAVRAELSA